MTRFRQTSWATLAAVMLLATATSATAEEANKDKWTPLFNGKDLSGWQYGKGSKAEILDGKTETSDKRFQVVGGVIVANEGKGIKDLWTVKQFDGDFQLKLEFRAALKADSGVYVRGPQLQVRDYTRRKERNLKKFKDDDWNELDIIVTGGKLLIGGKPLTEKDSFELTFKGGKPSATLNGKEVKGGLEVSVADIAACSCNGEFLENMKVPGSGPIGLQAETGKFEFRNVRIKFLK